MEKFIKYLISQYTGVPEEELDVQVSEFVDSVNVAVYIPDEYMGMALGKESKNFYAVRKLARAKARKEGKNLSYFKFIAKSKTEK